MTSGAVGCSLLVMFVSTSVRNIVLPTTSHCTSLLTYMTMPSHFQFRIFHTNRHTTCSFSTTLQVLCICPIWHQPTMRRCPTYLDTKNHIPNKLVIQPMKSYWNISLKICTLDVTSVFHIWLALPNTYIVTNSTVRLRRAVVETRIAQNRGDITKQNL